MRKLFLFAVIATLLTSCVKDIEVRGNQPGSEGEEANSFDFSTVQSVNLTVDYSAFNAPTPVLFSVYSENPFVGEDESMTLREDIKPLFEGYTGKNGKFNDVVKLPAYAKQLYVVTGNFFVTEYLMTADVKNGSASLIAENKASQAASRAAQRRAVEWTNSLETLYQLSYEVDVETGDKTNNQIYKEWQTPLGQWDRLSGRPNYLMDKATADSRLLFTDEETQGLYETVANALVSNKACDPRFRTPADLVLVKESEVALSFLGGVTCWNNTLGYYYYDEATKPQSLMDVNIIMLFPNTQDGTWSRDWMPNPNFYGNIALERGDVVKLMYYPNIANNGDLTGATTVFPKGTRIGFIMKSNGWGMQKTQGEKKFFNSYNGLTRYKEAPLSRQYNVWGASTDGLSYCNTTGLNPNDCKIQNPDGLSRTAKFAYESLDGKEYAIIGFEDACNDEDFDDVILALKPADVFQELPKVEEKKFSTTGVYGFEDLWPAAGDYDLNDALVEMTHEIVYSVKTGSTDHKIFQETFYLTTAQNYVELQSGLALTLDTKETPESIVMKKVDPITKDTTEVSYQVDGNTYLLTENIKAELGSTYIIELNYKKPGFTKVSNTAEAKAFIYRTESKGRWEVHIPYEAPTSKMITGYFGTLDDKSVPSENKYYVRSGNYPFAFYLEGVTLKNFENTLLLRENESVKIDELFPDFMKWVNSNGKEYTDWYLLPRE